MRKERKMKRENGYRNRSRFRFNFRRNILFLGYFELQAEQLRGDLAVLFVLLLVLLELLGLLLQLLNLLGVEALFLGLGLCGRFGFLL